MPNEIDVLRYGRYLTDDLFDEDRINYHCRIRTIDYEGKIIFHKMINGKTVEFEVLC